MILQSASYRREEVVESATAIWCPDYSSRHSRTLAFMAVDLLDVPPSVRYYRHDLESMFYALSIIVTGKRKSPLKRRWYSAPDQISQSETKAGFMFSSFPSSSCVGEYRRLFVILVGLRALFSKAMGSRSELEQAREASLCKGEEPPPAFDEETIGGRVNYEKFRGILELPF